MRLITIIILIIYASSCSVNNFNYEDWSVLQLEIIATGKLSHSWQETSNPISQETDWSNAVYLIGLYRLAEISNDKELQNYLRNWLTITDFKIQGNSLNPDNIAISYLYLQNYFDNNWIKRSNEIEIILTNHISDTSFSWWFADALFMAPPALSALSTINNSKYDKDINNKWVNTKDLLFSEKDSLYFRDKKFNNHQTRSGEDQFWLRGNGWVIAGLALTIEHVSKNAEEYIFYTDHFTILAEKLKTLQLNNGLWSLDLADETRFKQEDSSGSALICFGITWGINNKILERSNFSHTIDNCYDGITQSINEDGSFINVQPIGPKPFNYDPGNTEIFGSGTLFLFLSEYLLYLES